MKKFIGLALVLIAIIIAAVYFGTSVSETAQAENDYLRIHVRANSNEDIDQNVKYKVKDEVVKFITPYVLWSNYELDVEEKENISTNYLGSYLLDAMGVELPVYNRYLLELQEKIPAVNVNGFLDDQGTMHWIGETGSEYEEVLAEYRMFEYNNLFDGKDRLENVYE